MRTLADYLTQSSRSLAVLDGPCGSGKSTLALRLSQAIPTLQVVHMDDFYTPMSKKTRERLSVPGGNADWERLCAEVLTPWLYGQDGLIRPYVCHEDRYLPSVILHADCPLLIEGSYSGLPQISAKADFRFFLSISTELQTERILHRNGPDGLKAFQEKWIPLENSYFTYYHLPDPAWHVICQEDRRMLETTCAQRMGTMK